ncbi:alpha-D-ribose 1-methylphosphonate 5-triphosphate diphosphatase [Alisedimentitalea sp. MJ-SS2]|uniref:alpha-D-ribose 1-methylphosphonate 5-triphosphate diphosphatase n=1 Tax=Aliisedimentitalea sp. MJ-SS2 TaxID=3049795 RepID=UPI002907EF52|nr:alpha-D-ribose 1-methylphosphonate 5-triphosphate diphosphatase [Alisedimentitalea sp. MJ-SS2]MDU8927810.1 alpha-D-ribose 1-methylphosphonate 5-triphosphate diphosphatase [Alisedimentitalea sp. MJ-SS2]
MQQPLSLIGGMVLRPNRALEPGDVHVADGLIVETPANDSAQIDCKGKHVLPGIVDVHGDAFELELHPRPDIDIAFPIAMASVDRQLISNGITTAYHGLTLSWEPGARSLPAARAFMSGLVQERPNFLADHRVQLRWETFAHDALNDLAQWLTESPTPAIAFNDHTTETLGVIAEGDTASLDKWATRAGISRDDYVAQAKAASAHAANVPGMIAKVAAMGRQNGAIMLAHDETSAQDRTTHRALGMSVSEFPLTREAARAAVSNGEHTVMGAPNVLRGLSHKGNLSAIDAISEGLCTVLASDYYYPSQLHAAQALVTQGILPLEQAWALVSTNPAAAMGLTDRGAIHPGQRADMVVLDTSAHWHPHQIIACGAISSFG